MKLVDFTKFLPLNALKDRMGIPRNVFGTFSVSLDPSRLTRDELERLTSGEGLDVSFEELTVLDDGTLAYKDSRVLLYIRDVAIYGQKEYEPRYHLAHCKTLHEMKSSGRFSKYVIAAETSGIFAINVIRQNRSRSERRNLRPCQFCLDQLQIRGFSLGMHRNQRKQFVAEFVPQHFFDVYPRSLHSDIPRYYSDTAPLNNYTDDFAALSAKVRESIGYMCFSCGRDLSAKHVRRFLHVHHRNGIKSDNSPENLAALCVRCHANEPGHKHLKNSPDYKAFERL